MACTAVCVLCVCPSMSELSASAWNFTVELGPNLGIPSLEAWPVRHLVTGHWDC